MNEAAKKRSAWWRSSRWQFSLRELLLVMLAAAAFIGWGVLLYERSQRFAPSKLYEGQPLWREDIQSALSEIGEPTTATPFAITSARGPSVHHCESYLLPLTAANQAAFRQKFPGLVRQRLADAGCKPNGGEAAGNSGMSSVWMIAYRLDSRVGAVHVCMFKNDDNRLRIVVTMHEEGGWRGGFGVGVMAGS